MAGATALPLQQLIATLDSTCLPKILQVCSGVYFQGRSFNIFLHCELKVSASEDKGEAIKDCRDETTVEHLF